MAVQLGYKNVFRDPKGFPDWQAAGLPVSVSSAEAKPAADPGPLYGWAIMWTLMGVFLGGIALNLTPCVYPLIPITVSYFGAKAGRSRIELAAHALLYVLGLSLTNSVLGVTAALTGGLMGAALQNPIVTIAIAALLIAFATSLFGLWEFQLPQFLTAAAAKSHAGYFGSLFMGLTLGIVAAPCLGPFVLGLLTWVAGTGSPWIGFLVFFTLSMGLGLPLFVLALFSGSLDKLPGSGAWMVWVRKVMGWVLIGMAAYFVRPLLPGDYGTLLIAAVALGAGLHLGWLDKTIEDRKRLRASVAIIGVAICGYLIGSTLGAGPGVTWKHYSDALMSEAQKAGKPVLMDFSAGWCSPCRELDDITFRDPKVIEASKDRFVIVKVDLTTKGDSVAEQLVKKYRIKGVPTLVFLDKTGQERSDLRVSEFLEPGALLERMNKL